MKFSIIIPAYNCETYIGECIKSIQSQVYKKWELIIVNDGSKDRTYDVCKCFSINDDRIKIVSQSNSGPSSARNKGLELSNGEYCLFVDSDDYLESNALTLLRDSLVNGDKDIIFFGYFHEYYKKKQLISSSTRKFKNNNFTDNQQFKSYFLEMAKNSMINQVWNKCYNRAFIKNINATFPKNIKYTEDLIFNLILYKHAQYVEIIDYPLYHYINHQENSSLASSFDINRINDLKEVYKIVFNTIETWCPLNMNYFKNNFVHEVSVFIISLFNSNCQLSNKEKLVIIRNVVNDLVVREYVDETKGNNFRNKIVIRLIKFKFYHFLYLLSWVIRQVKKG